MGAVEVQLVVIGAMIGDEGEDLVFLVVSGLSLKESDSEPQEIGTIRVPGRAIFQILTRSSGGRLVKRCYKQEIC